MAIGNTPALDLSNAGTICAGVFVETLARLGLRTVLISPGSRSSPLTFAIARHPEIEAIPVLDERSAAFFALGRAKASHTPVALVCTSGTAAANYLPAVIEAAESGFPLIVCTADRPPELRHVQAGQTIDQHRLYGRYPSWETELPLPGVEPAVLGAFRQAAVHAWERSIFPQPGPVHLNFPFREPLVPIPDASLAKFRERFNPASFFANLEFDPPHFAFPKAADGAKLVQGWMKSERGVIVAGPVLPRRPASHAAAVGRLSQVLGWPVLSDPLNPLRFYPENVPHLTEAYEWILRCGRAAHALRPEVVIIVGSMPISRTLGTWIRDSGAEVIVVGASHRAVNPSLVPVRHVRVAIEDLATALPPPRKTGDWLRVWENLEAAAKSEVRAALAGIDWLFEGKVAQVLLDRVPDATPLWVGNSLPPRDLEWFGFGRASHVRPLFNRGAAGIDGTLSSALGAAHRNQASVLLTGDLSLLHDTNGFLHLPHLSGSLTVVLLDNRGGGIFEMLPPARHEPPFEKFFATPQAVDFARLIPAYGAEYSTIADWKTFETTIASLPSRGLRVLHLQTDRKRDAAQRRELVTRVASRVDQTLPSGA